MRTPGAVMLLVAGIASATFVSTARGEDAAGNATERRVTRAECVNACGEQYKTCVQRYEQKQPGTCGTSAVRCRAACPPRPVDTTSKGPAGVVQPSRDDGAAESVPSREPATTRDVREVPPSARRRPAEPPAPASSPVTSSAAAAPVTGSADADAGKLRSEPKQAAKESVPLTEESQHPRRRNWFQSIWCVFRPCGEATDDQRPSCTETCSADYHDCVTLGDKQRSQYCATDLAHCKERCLEDRPANQRR